MIIREATHNDIPALAKVHVDTWRTAYRGIMPDEYLANLSYEQRENFWSKILSGAPENGYFTYVAEDESGEVIGFASGGEEPLGDPVYKGDLKAIYILQNHQGKGIGRCLMQAFAKKLHLLGIDTMLVWVLADNSACQFYAALGGNPVHEKEMEFGGKSLIEVAYGWMDTGNLGRS